MSWKWHGEGLRRQAENAVLAAGALRDTDAHDLESLTHELRVHQAELEMQNEELRITQQQLTQTRDRYFELYDSAPVGYLSLNKDWRVIETNFTAAALLGTERARLIGERITGYLLESETEPFHFYKQRLTDAVDPLPFEGWFRRADGGVLRGMLKTTMVEEGFRTVLMDITAHRFAEEKLRQKEAQLSATSHRLQQIARITSDVFYVLDVESGKALYLSPAFETVFGRPARDGTVTPNRWLAWVHEDDRHRVANAVSSDRRSGTFELEYRIMRPDGGIRLVRDRCFPDPEQNQMVGILHDITQEHALEARLRQAQRMESLGTLAGGIAHDFNNLLMGVAGYLHLAAERLGPSHSATQPVERALKTLMRGSTLTKHLVSFGDEREREAKPLLLDKVVQETSDLLARLVGDHIHINLHTGAPGVQVRADAGEIEQFLMNLASNARDAMPNGGELTIETNVIEDPDPRRDGATGSLATISVKDTGCGMSEETRAKIFDPFFTTKDIGKGTGLGLSTVFTVVRRLKGYVTVESETGKGTTFTVSLPALRPTPAEVVAGEAAKAAPAESETILLVDDDDLVREAVEAYLLTLGYRVLPAAHVGEATHLCQEHHDEIRLLVCDVMMPGTLGTELAPQLQHLHGNLPVLFISAHSPAELERMGHIKEGAKLLTKPFDIKKLATTLRQMLDTSATQAAPAP